MLPDDASGWRAFFEPYADIVLVANSDAVDIAAISARFPRRCLFVFFNKAYKVLDNPFERESLLAARSSAAGANIVYRREVPAVTALLKPPGFRGVLNVRAAEGERFSAVSDFAGVPAGFLDLSPDLKSFYPADHVPSTGFALTIWLLAQNLPGRLHLAGFTGLRSEAWKVFHIHDWTFEQVVQRLLISKGRLFVEGESLSVQSLSAIVARFPEFDPGEVALTAAAVLSERLEGAHRAIDGLISQTKFQRSLRRLFQSLKPKTRKQKLAEAQATKARR